MGYLAAIWEGVSFVIVSVTSYLLAPSLREWLLEVGKGFALTPDPRHIRNLTQAKESSQVLKQSFINNIIFYGGITLFYNTMVRYVMQPVTAGTSYEEPEAYLENFITVCLFALVAKAYVNNFILSASVRQAASLDVPASSETCECKFSARLQSNLSSNVYDAANSITLYGVRNIVPAVTSLALAPAVDFTLGSLMYGQYFLKRGVLGNKCHDHAYFILSKNNAYAYGVGLSFMLMYYLGSGAAAWAGVRSWFLDDAMCSFLFHAYTAMVGTTALVHQAQLPGQEAGWDVSYPIRHATNRVYNGFMSNDPLSVDWIKVDNQLRNAQNWLNYPPIQLGTRWLLGVKQVDVITYLADNINGSDSQPERCQFFNEFFRQPIPAQFFCLYQQAIPSALTDLEDYRNKEIKKRPIVIVASAISIDQRLASPVELFVLNEIFADNRFPDWMQRARKTNAHISQIVGCAEASPQTRRQAIQHIFNQERMLPLASAQTQAPFEREASFSPLAKSAPAIFREVKRPNPPATVPFDIFNALKLIANQPFWDKEGLSRNWLTGHVTKLPGSIKEIREKATSLANMVFFVQGKDGSVKRSPLTQKYYDLINECDKNKYNLNACKKLINEFCDMCGYAKISSTLREKMGVTDIRYTLSP